ncbi:uncharacterized protein UHOD_11758 [Ustilago sp. UG-2017b]|nr:uncharacterized protein UHOD_11758 [Ustilago sp. UG-2017b]
MAGRGLITYGDDDELERNMTEKLGGETTSSLDIYLASMPVQYWALGMGFCPPLGLKRRADTFGVSDLNLCENAVSHPSFSCCTTRTEGFIVSDE